MCCCNIVNFFTISNIIPFLKFHELFFSSNFILHGQYVCDLYIKHFLRVGLLPAIVGVNFPLAKEGMI
jgi:hypothetical protein